MSRENAKSDNRCPVCGGRMRLVNVTWVNTFRTPEASQYDLSVSNRKALFGATPASSSQEMMCFSCSRRSPIANGKVEKVKKEKKVKKQEDKEEKKKKKNYIGSLIGWLIFLVFLAVTAYFVYKYRDVINGYINKIVELFYKVKDFIAKFQK